MSALHRLAHLLSLNKGRPESFWLDDELWTGFRCGACNVINGARRSRRSGKHHPPPPINTCRVLLFGVIPVLRELYAPGPDGPESWRKHLRPWIRWACVVKRESVLTATDLEHYGDPVDMP